MKELSLHILDIFYNSLKADASLIKIKIDIDTKSDLMTIKIVDNGYGMGKEFVKDVLNPFKTTRTTRKVGLGLSLFQASAIQCDGTFKVWSKKNVGTVVTATYKYSHIDRAPIGDMTQTIISMVLALENKADLIYVQRKDSEDFIFDTREIKEVLGSEVSLSQPDVIAWIKEYITSGIENLKED